MKLVCGYLHAVDESLPSRKKGLRSDQVSLGLPDVVADALAF